MRRPALALAITLLAACGGDDSASTPDAPLTPTANPAREVIDTALAFDLTAMSGTASITLGASSMPGATLEVGDLVLDSVSVPYAVTGNTLDLALPASGATTTIDFAFHYKTHTNFDGVSTVGFTFLWPYYCGNLFPCHSDPSDGASFTLGVTGVPAGKTAIYPTAIGPDAPAYQVAWSVDDYTEVPLGTTTAGTQVSVWHRAGEATTATNGTLNLVAAFDWFEKTIGPYRFGNKVGTVSVNWPAGAYGGMEHHPRWHVDNNSLGSQETNVHEAAHGWFGDGIRLQCWEDFVLSEGTVSYLAARALDVVAPSVGAQTWTDYANELGSVGGSDPVWPQSCGSVDILKDNLYTSAPYMRGAFFYKGIADKIGADKVDQALAAFYAAHAGGSATMAQMLETIQQVTGYDPTQCAQIWLKSTVRPTPGPCP